MIFIVTFVTETNKEKYIMCKYKKDKPQPKTLPFPRVTFTSECGFKLMLKEGYNMDWRNHTTYGQPINPQGKCMKCKEEIEMEY